MLVLKTALVLLRWSCRFVQNGVLEAVTSNKYTRTANLVKEAANECSAVTIGDHTEGACMGPSIVTSALSPELVDCISARLAAIFAAQVNPSYAAAESAASV
jgi:hypothetical protein